jgi:polar amino acid transport system substrate-binding protein
LQADENVEDDLRNAVWKGHYLGGGVADVMLHVPVDPEYARRIDKVSLFGPYYQERLEVVRNVKRIPQLVNLQIFAQEKIGVEVDSISSLYLLSAFGGRLRNNVLHFKTPREAVAAMRRGDVAAVMAPRTELEAGLAGDSEAYAITPVATPGLAVSAWPLGMAVKAENRELASALESAMSDLLKTGTVQSIFKKHGITHTAP